MATLIWSPSSIEDLEAILEFISRDSPSYAQFFISEMVDLIETIPEYPHAGRVVPEYGDASLRERIFQSYRIVYRVKDDTTVEIAAIFHGARLPSL